MDTNESTCSPQAASHRIFNSGSSFQAADRNNGPHSLSPLYHHPLPPNTHSHTHTHTYTLLYTHTYIYTPTLIYTHTLSYIHTNSYTCILQTHTHTLTHTHT